jgi:uncharacterized protein YlxW (UPF0749 family)
VPDRPWTSNRGFGPAFVIVLLVLGFILAAALIQERLRERELPEHGEELARLIEARRRDVRELSEEASGLSQRLQEIQHREIRASERAGRLALDLERLRGATGLVEVQGPGIVVELSDSATAPRSLAEETDLRIQDVDLQLVANALWRSGAEAVAVNGHRLSSRTAIRRAGSQILVNFRPVASPYRVAAIGDPEQLGRGVASSDLAEQFAVWEEVYGLGFGLRAQESMTLPPFPGLGELRWARPAEPRVDLR